jgi:uncharacterized integral membrane protein
MSSFKRVLLVLVAVLAVSAILAFVLENQQTVSLSFIGWSSPSAPISVFVVLSFILGLVIGPILGLLRRRKKNAQLKAKT